MIIHYILYRKSLVHLILATASVISVCELVSFETNSVIKPQIQTVAAERHRTFRLESLCHLQQLSKDKALQNDSTTNIKKYTSDVLLSTRRFCSAFDIIG